MKIDFREACPILSNVPESAQRLIDSGLLHLEASAAGNSERFRRGETSHTIHVWWARRPHSAMRALTFASLCNSNTPEAIDLLDKLSYSDDEETLEQAKIMLEHDYDSEPRALDMFGGGGTIPYEMLNLGINSFSIDSNQLSVFIQKANLNYSHGLNSIETEKLLKESGEKILSQLAEKTRELFPNREKSVTNYIWSYHLQCESCSKEFPLSKRFWLSKKKGKHKFLGITTNKDNVKYKIEDYEIEQESVWQKRANAVECPHCRKIHSGIDVKKAKDVLVVDISKESKGKKFEVSEGLSDEQLQLLDSVEATLLKKLDTKLPSSCLPMWSGIVNPAIYGVETHAQIFNKRQRVVCLALISCLLDEYDCLTQRVGNDTAKFVIASLSSLIDQVVDWNCRFSMWISQNEQVGRAFCGPGISMYWDYCETDPVANGPSNLYSKLKRIIEGAKAVTKLKKKGNVIHGISQHLPFEDKTFDALITDPPYYDNIFYTVLADNFYAWKRILLRRIEPELFNSFQTDEATEMVASKNRAGSSLGAHNSYVSNLTKCLCEAARVLKSGAPLSFVYSHSSVAGWLAIVESFRSSPLLVSSIQPLSIERKQRPRAVNSEAVNTCMVIVARTSNTDKQLESSNNIISAFEKILKSNFGKSLLDAGWKSFDVGLATFTQGIGLLANTSGISDKSDESIILQMEKMVADFYIDFKLKKRGSL